MKFHPSAQAFYPNDRAAYPLCEVIAEARLPALGPGACRVGCWHSDGPLVLSLPHQRAIAVVLTGLRRRAGQRRRDSRWGGGAAQAGDGLAQPARLLREARTLVDGVVLTASDEVAAALDPLFAAVT